jgi:hypothetical protein
MRDELDRLLREATLFTLAFAIAIGWSLYQFAHGVATFLDALITHLPPGSNNRFIPFYGEGGGLTWVVGRHVVTLDGMFLGLVELAVVLLVAAIVRRRTAPPS